MVPLHYLNDSITFLSLLGLGLSIYAFTVEFQLENDSKYVAMCDISERISCTKTFKSEYARGFGLVSEDSFFYKPNSLLGVFFYCLTATLGQSDLTLVTRLSFLTIIISNLTSVYFAYILFFKLYVLCIVCVSTYVLNAGLFIVVYSKLKVLKSEAEEAEAQKKRQ